MTPIISEAVRKICEKEEKRTNYEVNRKNKWVFHSSNIKRTNQKRQNYFERKA